MNLFLILITTCDYSIESYVSFLYDDNIFNYSKKYLQEFIQKVNPERFPFETYDDLYANYGFKLLIRNKFFGSHTTTFNIDFVGYNYLVNNEKDYILASIGARQSFGKFATKLEYLFMPGYLIRYYQDPGGTKYIGCDFNEHLFTIKTNLFLNKIGFSIVFGYEIDDYNPSFDIYDSKAIRIGPSFDYALTRSINTRLNYEFKSLKAKGPTPDISYLQHRIRINPNIKFIFPKLSKLDFEYQLKYRLYTTEVSPLLDTPHSGRQDITQRLKFSYEFPILTKLYLSLNYAYEFRISQSKIYQNIGDYKNYNKWTAGYGLEFSY